MAETPTTDLFFGLTPDHVLAAVEAAGLATRPVCYPLNSFENRVYEVELADRSRVIAKFYRPGRWSAEQIGEEHAFLAELADEEVPVCPVRPFPDGHTVGETAGIFYALFERRGGRAPDEIDEALAARAGRLAARIHNVGARRDAPHRLRLDADSYVRRQLSWLDAHGTLPRHLASRYRDAAEAIAALADHRLAGVAVQRLHGDLHHGNLLLRDDVLHVLDFDDMVVGPPVQDVWLLFPGRDDDSRRRREVFLAAYEELRLFDRATLSLVEPLRGLRLVRYAVWIARRWNDPAFRAGWPEFGTDEWWRRETDDLEEVLRVARRDAPGEAAAGLATPRPADEELLSNKDYFWDWEGD